MQFREPRVQELDESNLSGRTSFGARSRITEAQASVVHSKVPGFIRYTQDGYEVEVPTIADKDAPLKNIRRKGIYWGFPRDFYIPEPTATLWNRKYEGQVNKDLDLVREYTEEICSKKRKSPTEGDISTEIFMTGIANGKSNSVMLSACLWIFCGSWWCKNKVKRYVSDWTAWRGFSTLRPVIISGGNLQLCTVPTAPILLDQLKRDIALDLGFAFGRGEVFYHVEVTNSTRWFRTACGLLCVATYVKGETVVKQHVSRIGGLLTKDLNLAGSRNDLTIAMTAAHGIFEEIWPASTTPAVTYGSNVSDDESDCDSEGSDLDDFDLTESLGRQESIGARDPSSVHKWKVADNIAEVNYFGRGYPSSAAGNGSTRMYGDYALLETSMNWGDEGENYFGNYYWHDGGPILIEKYIPSEDLIAGPLLLIIDDESSAIEAYLLPGESTMYLRGVEIPIRKIQLSCPLAPGMSGSWVVRGQGLCGMIVAHYPGLPMAAFITAENILDNARGYSLTRRDLPNDVDELNSGVPGRVSEGYNTKKPSKPSRSPPKVQIDDRIYRRPSPDSKTSSVFYTGGGQSEFFEERKENPHRKRQNATTSIERHNQSPVGPPPSSSRLQRDVSTSARGRDTRSNGEIVTRHMEELELNRSKQSADHPRSQSRSTERALKSNNNEVQRRYRHPNVSDSTARTPRRQDRERGQTIHGGQENRWQRHQRVKDVPTKRSNAGPNKYSQYHHPDDDETSDYDQHHYNTLQTPNGPIEWISDEEAVSSQARYEPDLSFGPTLRKRSWSLSALRKPKVEDRELLPS